MPTAALAPETIRAGAGRVLADSALQRDLPAVPTLDVAPEWLVLLVRVLLAAGLAAVVVVAAMWLWRRLRGHVPDVTLASPESGSAPIAIPTTSAEALAAAGRYAEAIHALLLDTLTALSRAARLAPSLTSREIVARALLAPAAREALASLVAVVEVSHFGGVASGEGDYQACLARFHTFLQTYRSAP
jgi:hypothetical protein